MSAPNFNGSSTSELKTQMHELKQAIADSVRHKADTADVVKLQTQLDAIDVKLSQRLNAVSGTKSIADSLRENESISRLLRDRKGSAVLEFDAVQAAQILGHKSIISAVASGSSNGDSLAPVGTQLTGVLPIDRIPGITAEARQGLTIRNILYARPTTMQVVDFVKVATPMSIASPVPEASLKPENQLTFTAQSERVKLLATWIPATRQVLDDFQELLGFIQSSLGYYINWEEELQLLAGDNVQEDLHGLIPQASAFNTSLLPAAATGYTRMDIVATAIEQIQIAKEIDPTFIVLNPADWWKIRLTKTSFGQYILGNPQETVRANLFGLDVVSTNSMQAGNFLVGSGNPAAAEIRDRMGLQVEVSTEHSSFFTSNLVAIRGEKRLCLVVKRAASFIQGTFLTSPAS